MAGFFFHGFWVMIFLLIAGIVIFIRLKNPLVLSLSIGIFTHQIADSMWNSPVNWFWPLFGSYVPEYDYHDYFFEMFVKEISSMEEVFSLIFIILALIIYFLWKKKYIKKESEKKDKI